MYIPLMQKEFKNMNNLNTKNLKRTKYYNIGLRTIKDNL